MVRSALGPRRLTNPAGALRPDGQVRGPTAMWSAFGVVRMVLDHVLASGRRQARGSGVLTMAGSDHRALWARIAQRPPG